MNFDNLRHSKFLKVGMNRYDSKAQEIITAPLASYDVSTVTVDNLQLQNDPDTLVTPLYMNVIHLGNALIAGDDYIPREFRNEIYRQWQEVDSIFKRTGQTPRIAKLVIQTPGSYVGSHIHKCKQTLTFGYRYQEEKITSDDSSYLILGPEHDPYRIDFPDHNKICFTFLDQLAHAVYSKEWAFYWFGDFDDYVEIPKDIDFQYLDLSRQKN
jgi:hypothetical protein